MPAKNEIHRTLREAIHHTYANCPDKKPLAANLDWSPSELSQRTTLGTEGRAFPADDPAERLVVLMRETGDSSYLATLADKCGFELRPKQERLPELVSRLASEAKRLNESIQLVLATPWVSQTKGKR